MTNPPVTQGPEGPIVGQGTPPNGRAEPRAGWLGTMIHAARSGVTEQWVHMFLAILAGLALRLAFIHWFPTNSVDSETYLQLARNWLDFHMYGLSQNGQLVPTDLRAPGYPAFLAGLSLVFRRSQQAILLSQAALDLFTCFLAAALAAVLAPAPARHRVWIAALWLAAACPFVANYTATILTEVLVTFLSTAALFCFALALQQSTEEWEAAARKWIASPITFALAGAFVTGIATLVRPEMPLLLCVAVAVFAVRVWRTIGVRKTVLAAAAIGCAFLLPLLPWAVRNAISLKKVQFLASRYATFPGEYVPLGYYAWTGTWLERYRDVYTTIWKISEERLDVNDLPASAFDSPAEKARIADLITEYNVSENLDISPEMDRQFAEIARERTRRHPFRTYLEIPFQRALTLWFTPRIELLPIDGKISPLRDQWEDSPANVLVTGGFALLGYLYVAVAICGVLVVLRERGKLSQASEVGEANEVNLWGVAVVMAYLLARTALFMSYEAPEPRYVVSCYPVLLALAALLWVQRETQSKA